MKRTLISRTQADITSQESARSRVRVDQCVSALRAVDVPVLVCLHSSCNHVIAVGVHNGCESRAECGNKK